MLKLWRVPKNFRGELMGEEGYKAKLLEKKAEAIISAPNISDDQAYLDVLKYMYERNLQPKAIEIAHNMNTEIVGVIQKDLAFIKTLKAPSEELSPSTVSQTQDDQGHLPLKRKNLLDLKA